MSSANPAHQQTEKQLRGSQSSIKGKLTIVEKYVSDQAGAKLDQDDYDALIKKVNTYNELIEALHQQIFPFCSDTAAEDAQNSEFEGFFNRFLKLRSEIRKIKPDTIPTATKVSVKLPELELPTFDGEYENWTSFHDLFVASVHNHSGLADSQKLQYLKRSVQNEAQAIIKNLPVSDKNYLEAWKLLKSRYSNKREIINAHLRRLFSHPTITNESGSCLRKLLDVTQECIQALKVCGEPTQHWDTWLVFLVTEKLDPGTRREWVISLKRTQVPTFEELTDFLNQRASALTESASKTKSSGAPKPTPKLSTSAKKETKSSHQTSTDYRCRICSDGSHPVHKCSSFHKLSLREREEQVRSKGLCLNCLGTGHRVNSCPSKSTCRKCSHRHHTLIHHESTAPTQETTQDTQTTVSLHNHRNPIPLSHVLLPTAVVNVVDNRGNLHPARALLDSASEVSLISTSLVSKLGLKTAVANVTVTGLSSTNVGTAQKKTQVQLSSRVYNFKTTMEALVFTKVTGRLPSAPCNPSTMDYIRGLKLADPFFYKPEAIDMLIGADLYASLQRPTAVIQGPPGMPTATDTQLGWVISGRTATSLATTVSCNVTCGLDELVKQFWDLQEQKEPCSRESQAEEHFVRTHTRLPDGRYMVALPFKDDSQPLGPSREIAIRRLKSVERRLKSQPELRTQYVRAIQEYQLLGHMERVPTEELEESPQTYYMPHHSVLKEASSTTKLRVVFDASCKSASGISLNENLLVGPKTQDDLVAHLIRFRMWTVAFTADVKQMYSQFLLQPQDRDYHRIVWREDPAAPVEDWRMTKVTFGDASAPFLATRALMQLAEDEKDELPRASQVTKRDTYVDDLLSGENSIEDAIALQDQLLELFRRGHLELRKWASNHPALLERLPCDQREPLLPVNLGPDDIVKTLGIQWNPSGDYFSFPKIILDKSPSLTKRAFLSLMSRIFDPLGWLSPVTIRLKIIFQLLWKEEIAWDDPIPSHILLQWNSIADEIGLIEEVKIPRHVVLPNSTRYEILGFSDASEKAYGAVVYLKSFSGDEVQVSLLSAKTRVAPTKQETLPRLELCGALLLIKLVNSIQSYLQAEASAVYLWTDSTIVLAWIASPSSSLNTFVANRVAQIQKSFPRSHWNHVKGTENPADCISRGISPSQFSAHSLWWTGPDWASHDQFNFSQPIPDCPTEPLPEAKKRSMAQRVKPEFVLLNKFSSLLQLRRVVAWIYRFYYRALQMSQKTLPTHPPMEENLTAAELQHALNTCVLLCQRTAFPEELKSCQRGVPVDRKSPILPLSPFIDSIGLLRVGGRLKKAADLSTDQKHPILLPRHGPLTQLILAEEHHRGLHAGPQLLLSMIVQRYWIIRGRDATREFVKKCLVCFRHRAKSATQKMGDLPLPRISQSRPFLKCGVDYAGPFHFKTSFNPRNAQTRKAYVALFVCFATRAIHLELVSDMTTECFIAALKRFISRRGLCSDIFSDCGLNFVGADRELRSFFEFLRAADDRVASYLAARSVTWHFNAPASPHFGGLWEAGVGVVKGHLKRAIGGRTLSFEELATVLAQAEACVNSRPLTPLSCNPEDMLALTPGHFLIGAPLNSIPEPDLSDINLSRLSRWQLCQAMVQHFWSRWHKEYLSQLQNRPKWKTAQENLKIGDMVLLKEERSPVMSWKLGRVIATHPGEDKLVRVVTVKTENGEYKRPVVKCCVLPFDQTPSEIPS